MGQGKGQGWQGYVNSIPSNGAGVLAITTAVVSVTVTVRVTLDKAMMTT